MHSAGVVLKSAYAESFIYAGTSTLCSILRMRSPAPVDCCASEPKRFTSAVGRGALIARAFRLEWIDSVASLAILWLLVKEGREAWTGGNCCVDAAELL